MKDTSRLDRSEIIGVIILSFVAVVVMALVVGWWNNWGAAPGPPPAVYPPDYDHPVTFGG